MIYNTEKIIDTLIDNISAISEVQAIGISGSKAPLPKAGEGDIDIFIYCNEMPYLEKRQAIINQMGDQIQEGKINIFEGGHFGVGDFMLINGVETWLMYFTVSETLTDVEAILKGEYPDKLDNYYYPVGRCAMFRNINVLYDKNGFLHDLKERLSEYPDELSGMLTEYHMDELEDTEDLERAVMRKDVLFYHFAMDLAIDHFLQALFAINKTYFPSRKRTLDFIENFTVKPEKCSERLLEVVRLGGFKEGIHESFMLWSNLVRDLNDKRFITSDFQNPFPR